MTTGALDWRYRFAGHRVVTIVVLAAIGVLVLWGGLTGSRIPANSISDDPNRTDSALYGAIVDRMDDGLSYYQAVAKEQPSRGYPTSPAMTVREPTLAWVTSELGETATVALLWVLLAGALALSVVVYERTERSRRSWVGATLMATLALGIFALPSGVHVHEVWVAPLVYLGLLTRGAGWSRTSLAFLLAAALVRELVGPVMLLMLALAILGRRRSEARRWCGGLVVFGGFYLWHLHEVHQLAVGPSTVSPGWLALGGWPFVVDAVRASSVLTVLPFWVAAVAVPLGLLGWVARRGPLFDLVSAFLLGYCLLFCFVGRPDNSYWGAWLAVMLLPGIVFGVLFLGTLPRLLLPASHHAGAA